MKQLVSEKEMARMLGVAPLTLYRQRKVGLPYVRVGRQVRYDPDVVKRWMDATENTEEEHGEGR